MRKQAQYGILNLKDLSDNNDIYAIVESIALGGLAASVAHMTGHLPIYGLAGIVKIMAFGFQPNSGANGGF